MQGHQLKSSSLLSRVKEGASLLYAKSSKSIPTLIMLSMLSPSTGRSVFLWVQTQHASPSVCLRDRNHGQATKFKLAVRQSCTHQRDSTLLSSIIAGSEILLEMSSRVNTLQRTASRELKSVGATTQEEGVTFTRPCMPTTLYRSSSTRSTVRPPLV